MISKNKKLYFEWDTISWSRAMNIWCKYLESNRGKYVLEVGSRNGGISLMLAKEYGMQVVCSDLINPETSAQLLHKKYKTNHKIKYEGVDCVNMSFEDNTFDVVIFKSVVGALGFADKQSLAFNEMFRVLKPGGVLLFAENLNSSFLHMYLRRKFIPWDSRWRYLKLNEIHSFLENYNFVELETTGFFANLISNNLIKKFSSYFDYFFEKILPKKIRYIVYGAAIK
jgi:ubiquinone/menaquinone biosynthesis C-methylase UbiE